jgi:hypothetical protein
MLFWGGGIISYYATDKMSNMPTCCYFSLPLIIILNILRAKISAFKGTEQKGRMGIVWACGKC